MIVIPIFQHLDPFLHGTRTITSNSALLGKAQEEHRQQFRKLRRYLTYFQVRAGHGEMVGS